MEKKETLSLPVEGMTCASCVVRVENTLKKLEGIENVNVNLATEKVTFTYDHTKADLDKISEAVDNAGYKMIIPSNTTGESVSESSLENDQSKRYKELKSNFIFSLILTIPVMIINMISMTSWFMKW